MEVFHTVERQDYHGAKGGSSKQHTPTESPDSLNSIAVARMLIGLGEGEFKGGFDATRIKLDGTPIQNSDGSVNFPDVTWDWRPGTQTQTMIPGFPSVENESAVGVALKYNVPWVRAITNTQIDAVRIRIGVPTLLYQEDDGDRVGSRVDYKIELSTNGGPLQLIGNYAFDGKTTSLYERDHRIDLPQVTGNTVGWRISITRLTADSTNTQLVNATNIEAYTEIVDARLRYPHTALLYVSFNAKSFPNIPKVSVVADGRLIRVPANYDPVTRQYNTNGAEWDGTWKWAWSDNPAWVFQDICIEPRFGIGKRIDATMLDKWTLYQIAQRCDQLVPTGRGDGSTEPRYLCNVYIQSKAQAWTVVKDLAAVFSGMMFWGNSVLNVLSDRPGDIVQILTRADVTDGAFQYSGGSVKNRKSVARVAWDNPANSYQSEVTTVAIPRLVERYDWEEVSITGIGCTRESEAQRRGRYVLETNVGDDSVSFSIGLEGIGFKPGDVIAIADDTFSGRQLGGRIMQATLNSITTDRYSDAAVGDTCYVRCAGGVVAKGTIASVTGDVIRFGANLSAMPLPQGVWCVDTSELALQTYRITTVTFDEENNLFQCMGVIYQASKYDAVDTGARLDERPTTLIPDGTSPAPASMTISSFTAVVQGMAVQTMRLDWAIVKGAVEYQVQWKRGNNDWVDMLPVSATSVEVQGIYAGTYQARVRAINALGSSSPWCNATAVTLTGKDGDVPAPLNLAGTPLLYGIKWGWDFAAANTGDLLRTELEYRFGTDLTEYPLSSVAYPGVEYSQMGIAPAQLMFCRARCQDRIGNYSEWTDWVPAESSSDANEYLKGIADAFLSAEDGKALQEAMGENYAAILENAAANNATIKEQFQVSGRFKATVAQITTTIANNELAFAEYQTVTNARMDNNEAQVNQKLTSTITATSASALYSLGLKVAWNGNIYTAGMSLGVVPDGSGGYVTRVAFKATEFLLLTDSGGTTSPFAVSGANVFIDNALIQTASLTMAKIERYIRSASWDSSGGASGWMLDQQGNATFNNATVRGTVYATGGSFANLTATNCVLDSCTINANCTILGTLNASKINGPLVQTKAYQALHTTTNASATINWAATAGNGDTPMTLHGLMYAYQKKNVKSSMTVAGQTISPLNVGRLTDASANIITAYLYSFSIPIGTAAAAAVMSSGALDQSNAETTQWVGTIFASPTANGFT